MIPTSRRQIEAELMRALMQNVRLEELLSREDASPQLKLMLPVLLSRRAIGSLAITASDAEFDICRFLKFSTDITNAIARGTEELPGQMLAPSRLNVALPLDILHALAEWYTVAYEQPFRSPYGEPQKGSIPIEPSATQHARLQLGDEIFGSVMSPRYRSNAYIRAKFVLDRTEDTDVYPGQVQYFIEHELAGMIHRLAIVKWYRPARSVNVRYRLGLDGDPRFCNSELWSDKFYPLNRESILPVHNILGRFVRVPANASNKSKDALDCIAVVPLNRWFNL